MKYKRYLTVVGIFILYLCSSIAPVSAIGIGIAPGHVYLDVPSNGKTSTTFYVTSYDYDGEVRIGLENIPLRVEPEKIRVNSSDSSKDIVLTFYGNESYGNTTFYGKITFLALGHGTVATGIKVKANVTQTVPIPKSTSPSIPKPIIYVIIGILCVVLLVVAISRLFKIEIKRK